MNKLLFAFFIFGTMACNQSGALDPQNKIHLVAQPPGTVESDGYMPPSYAWSMPWNPVCEAGDFCWKHFQPFAPNISLKSGIMASLAFPDGTLWLIGQKGLILKKPGNQNNWQQIDSPVNTQWKSIVGANSNEVWISADTSGHVLHCKNDTCTLVLSATVGSTKLIQTDATDVWISHNPAADPSTNVYRFDATKEQFISMDTAIQTQLPQNTTYQVAGIWGNNKNNVSIFLAPNNDGSVLRITWDGSKFGAATTVRNKGSLFFPILYGVSNQTTFPDVWLQGYPQKIVTNPVVYHSTNGTTWIQVTDQVEVNAWLFIRSIHFYDNQIWLLSDSTNPGQILRVNTVTKALEKQLDLDLPLSTIDFWVTQSQVFLLEKEYKFPLADSLALYRSQPGPGKPLSLVWQMIQTQDLIQNQWTPSKEERFVLMKDSTMKQHIVHEQEGKPTQSYTFPEEITVGVSTGPDELWLGGKNAIYLFKNKILTKFSRPEDLDSLASDFVINSMWGQRFDDVWAVSNKNHVFHFDGNTWSLVATTHQVFSPFSTIFGTQSDKIWFSGKNILIHFDGTQFSGIPLPSDQPKQLNIKWGWESPAGEMWFTDEMSLFHLQNNQLVLQAPPAQPISSVFQSHSGEVWLIANNKLFQNDGSTWQEVIDLSANPTDWQITGYDQNELLIYSPSTGYVLRKQK